MTYTHVHTSLGTLQKSNAHGVVDGLVNFCRMQHPELSEKYPLNCKISLVNQL